MIHSEIIKTLIISIFSTVEILEQNFFLKVLVDWFPLGSRSVDPHIFTDPDPGSQNVRIVILNAA